MDNNTSQNNPQQSSNTNQPEQNPVKPAEVRLAGDDRAQFGQPSVMQPVSRVAPIAPGLGSPLPPQRQGGRMALIIVGIALLVLGICALIFYFAYWTNPSVVLSRFQSKSEKILTQTLSGQINLANSIDYDLSIKSTAADNPVVVDSKGRNTEKSSESSTKISYKNTPLTLDIKQPEPTDGKINFYIKYQGLNKFLRSVLSSSQIKSFGISTAGVQKYDNKWLLVSIDDAINTLNSTQQGPENSESRNTNTSSNQINQTDLKELSTKIAPIIAKSISGTDKDTALFSYDKPKSETVNGIASYAYNLSFNSTNYQKLLTSLLPAIDQTNLSQAKKDTIKEQVNTELENSKNGTPNENTKTTLTLWLEKNSAIPVQIESTVETRIKDSEGGNFVDSPTNSTSSDSGSNSNNSQSQDNQSNSSQLIGITRFKIGINAFNTKEFAANFSITNEDPSLGIKTIDSSGTINAKLDGSKTNLDNKSIIQLDRTSKPTTFESKINLQKSSSSNPVEKPATATKLDTALKELFRQ